MPLHPALFVHAYTKKNVIEILHTILMLWATECEGMMDKETDVFGKEAAMLKQIARDVHSAGECVQGCSFSANTKGSTVWNTLAEGVRLWGSKECVVQVHHDLIVRAMNTDNAQEAHIKTEIKNALSFLDNDPEVKKVIEAHQILQNATALVDAWLHACTGKGICLKHHHHRGSCVLEIWHNGHE